jgi:DNA-binding response OmpR family regulator
VKKILIIEDDRHIGDALTIRLKAAGYGVARAEDALQAVSMAVREPPDLMLVDISIPAGDGFSVVERLRRNTSVPEIPVVFLTASKRPEYREQALRIGACAYVEKPFEAAELLRVVEDALEGPVQVDG